jgi:4a-hydroxytetrahydrobiopterin dehydratase
MSELLSQDELAAKLRECPEWIREGGEIARALKFKSFPKAIAFVNEVAALAEEANHHPDIDIRYSKVVLRLTTHDRGGLTARDLELARRIDRLAGQ